MATISHWLSSMRYHLLLLVYHLFLAVTGGMKNEREASKMPNDFPNMQHKQKVKKQNNNENVRNDSMDDESFIRILQRTRLLVPALDVSSCSRMFKDTTLKKVQCHYRGKGMHGSVGADENHCIGPPEPRLAWLITCLATLVVKTSQYQVPVYTLMSSPPNRFRSDRLHSFLANASLSNITTWYTVPLVVPDHEFKTLMQFESKETPETKNVRITFAHLEIMRKLQSCSLHSVSRHEIQSTCFSPGLSPSQRYALVLEDDAIVPVQITRLLVELLISAPHDVDLYFLDDSFHSFIDFQPPPHLSHNSPFTNSWPRPRSRTNSAYLISEHTILTGSKP